MKVDLSFPLETVGNEAKEGTTRKVVLRVNTEDFKDVELEVIESRKDGTMQMMGRCKPELSTLLRFIGKGE